MKQIVLFLLRVYKVIVSPFLHRLTGVSHACRFSPTCSEYATIHITREGIVKGGAKSFLRLLYCQPFTKRLPRMLEK